jgi:hypothetical protein
MQIDYVKISYKEDVHICYTNFTKTWNKIYMEQLVGGKCIEYNCFLRTLKFEMYPLSHGNVYNQAEHYPKPLLICRNEGNDERGCFAQNVHNEVDTLYEAVHNGSRNTNRDNKDVQDYHNWEGSISTRSSLHAWKLWPYYNNL